MKNTIPFVLSICFVLLIPPAIAAPPQTISYQGYLTGAPPGSTPVTGTVGMTFKFYNDPTAGGSALLHTELKASVTVTNGNFNVLLGSPTPIPLPFDVPYWLGVTITGESAEMIPRQPLASSAYAFRAAALDSSATVLGSQLSGTISNAAIAGSSLAQLQSQFAPIAGVLAPQATTITNFSGGMQGYNAITVGADGLPVIAYVASGAIAVKKCSNTSCTSATTATVDTVPLFSDIFHSVSIAISADGLPILAYAYTNSTSNLNALKVAKCSNAACTGAASVTTVDPSGNVGQYASIAIGADGLPVIAYWDIANNDLKILKCFLVACTGAAAVTTVDSAGSVGSNTSIAIGADGFPVVAYGSLSSGVSKIAKCSNNTCSSSTITPLPAGAGFGLTSIAIGIDGLPVVAVGASTGVAVTRCLDAACTSTTVPATVGPPAGFVIFVSLVIGADGLPLAAFNDPSGAPTMILKVAKCSNIDCSGPPTINTVDSGSGVGTYVSASIGADGLPILSYSATNQLLTAAKCSNAFCAPFFRRR